jgi:LAGLIDADG DNA endonuclease family
MLRILLGLLVIIVSFDLTDLLVIHHYSDGSEVVVWGQDLYSNVSYPRFTKFVSNLIQLPPLYKGVVIGLLLSNGWITFASKPHKNARLGFKQGVVHFEYFWSVFIILSHYCSSLPHFTSSIRLGVQSLGIQFFTRSLPCFTELYLLFYVAGNKGIPIDIFHLLTPIALAH